MKNQQEELHKLQEVLSLAKKDLQKAYETKSGWFVYAHVFTLCTSMLLTTVYTYVYVSYCLEYFPLSTTVSGTMIPRV